MQTKRVWLKLSELKFNVDNVRLVNNGDHLLESIKQDGIKKPLLVELDNADGLYVAIQGNCRLDALNQWYRAGETDFKAMFPKGIPCDLVTEWTDNRERGLACADHGEVRSLSTPYEVFRSVQEILKFEPELGRGEIVVRLSNTLDTVWPIRDTKALGRLATAKELGPKAFIAEQQKVRTSVSQTCLQVAKGPAFLLEFYKELALGIEPALPMTRDEVGRVYGAYLKDQLLLDSQGICPWDRFNNGPNVNEIIELIKESNAKKAGDKSLRLDKPKVMTSAALDTLKGSATSKTLKRVLALVSGSAKFDLTDLDKALKALEEKGELT